MKLGVENPKSGISVFRICRKFLVEIGGFGAYDGYKYSASGMIDFLLFVRLCRFEAREEGCAERARENRREDGGRH